MTPRLYVETNFVMAIAKGQDREADAFLKDESSPIRLAIPAVCFLEALLAVENEDKQRRKQAEELRVYAKEVGRDSTSPASERLVRLLELAATETGDYRNAVRDRLNETLLRLARRAEIVNLDHEKMVGGLFYDLIKGRADNLILSCIWHHAYTSEAAHKAFLSGNSRDFDTPSVHQELKAVGVHYFKSTRSALGWLESQGRAAGEESPENLPHPDGPESES